MTLHDGMYLNDTIIDVYFKWLFYSNTTIQNHIYHCSCQFYSTIVRHGPRRVISWTKRTNTNIFQKQILLFPINEQFHWSLGMVLYPANIAHPTLQPYICILDSADIHATEPIANNIRNWLTLEWNRHNNQQRKFTTNNCPLKHITTPKQQNGYDCGIFTCKYASILHQIFSTGILRATANNIHTISTHPKFRFTQQDATAFRASYKQIIQDNAINIDNRNTQLSNDTITNKIKHKQIINNVPIRVHNVIIDTTQEISKSTIAPEIEHNLGIYGNRICNESHRPIIDEEMLILRANKDLITSIPSIINKDLVEQAQTDILGEHLRLEPLNIPGPNNTLEPFGTDVHMDFKLSVETIPNV